MPEPLTQEYLDKKLDEKFDQFANTVQRGFADAREHVDARFDEIDRRFSAVDARFSSVDATLTRISIAVADLKVAREEDRERLRRLEESADRVYNRIDEFLVIMKRQEAELTALRAKYDRIEERLERVEKHLALQPA